MMDAVASSKRAPEAPGRPDGPPVTAREAVDKMVQAGLLDDLMDQVDGGGLQLTGEGGFLPELVRRVLEAGLEVERSEHLGYEKHDPVGNGSGNSRTRTGQRHPTITGSPHQLTGGGQLLLRGRPSVPAVYDGLTPTSVSVTIDPLPPSHSSGA